MFLILLPGSNCEVWASQFPFLHNLKDVIPPSEACLYGHINWSLAQTQQQSSIGLSQAFPLEMGGKTSHVLGSASVCKRDLCGSPVVPLWLRGLTRRVALRLIQVARSVLVVLSLPALLMLGRRGPWGSALLMCHSPQPLIILVFCFTAWYAFLLFGSMEKHYFKQVCA